MNKHDPVKYVIPSGSPGRVDSDPVTTEIVRNSLFSAANQMKRALIRTAFSPVIYEVLDFAAAIYNSKIQLLAQAPSLPAFMGTLNFCVDAAVKAVGGPDRLEPGDIILYNWPYGTGSHPQDAALVMPVFLREKTLIGYTAIKAHWLDVGAKEPYCTDTTDVFQEGVVFPGVKLFSRGELVRDVYRMVLANSRVPKAVAGDIRAQATGVTVGGKGFERVVERFGLDVFENAVEHMFDHGEAIVRNYFEKIPDGRYVAHGQMDNDGLDDVPVPFEIEVEVEGSTVRIDYSRAPDATLGPINCPLPSTVSGSRIAISMLAGGSEAPTEGHFRPIEVITRPGSMFHPLPPSPCFLYGWPLSQAIEVIYRALADAIPEAVPACSGGDVLGLIWWGTRNDTGELWASGSPHPVGQGGCAFDDGGTLMHIAESATRFAPTEVWEAMYPWLLEKVELVPDSGGAGKFRGGLGIDFHFRVLEDSWLTAVIERTKLPAWGLLGGTEGRANGAAIRRNGELGEIFGKATAIEMKTGEVLELYCGGGGGYGQSSERDPELVQEDLRQGYITEEHARKHYPHALAP